MAELAGRFRVAISGGSVSFAVLFDIVAISACGCVINIFSTWYARDVPAKPCGIERAINTDR